MTADEKKWVKTTLTYQEYPNYLRPVPLKKPQFLRCHAEMMPHVIEVSKIYVQNKGQGDDLAFAICPRHYSDIKITIER